MKVWLLLVAASLWGCGGTVSTLHRGPQMGTVPAAPPGQSLISSDGATLSDAEIHRILDARAVAPERPRIALVHLEHRSAHRSTGSSEGARRTLGPKLVTELRRAGTADASYLPEFLFSRSPSVAQLREAAARYQADWLFLFSTDCKLHDKFNVFSPDQVRAECHADSAVLDVRTGLLPFVSRSSETVTIEKSDSDFSLGETVLRAESKGVDIAMLDNAKALNRFMARARPQQPAKASRANATEVRKH